jgi:hypothetical protein
MRFRATSIDKRVLDTNREMATSFLKGLNDLFEVTLYRSNSKRKSGVYGYDDPVITKMYIRPAEEARQSDLLLGIIINGSHVAVASMDDDIINDDVIVSNGDRYTVKNKIQKTGCIYWILDLEQLDVQDIGAMQ